MFRPELNALGDPNAIDLHPERQTSLNLSQLHVDDDGRFRVVLRTQSGRGPGWQARASAVIG